MEQNYTLFSTEPSSQEWYFFKNQTELGQIYSVIKWSELENLLPFDSKLKAGLKRIKKRRKSLIYLLNKGISEFQKLLNQRKQKPLAQISKRFKIIKMMHQQQTYLHQNKKTSVPNRIVSLSQEHIRPIVRGKENKPD